MAKKAEITVVGLMTCGEDFMELKRITPDEFREKLRVISDLAFNEIGMRRADNAPVLSENI